MPIASGAIGRASVLAAPRGGWAPRGSDVPLGGWHPKGVARGTFRSRQFATTSTFITGITKDATGTPLAGATVDLFRTWDDVLVDTATSDGSGNYTLRTAGSGTFYVVAYKSGAPDVGGVTVNTLVGA